MNQSPRLLVWNYTRSEKEKLDAVLTEIKAPPAFSIEKDQGRLVLGRIIHDNERGGEEFRCDEKVLLFYNIPQKGVYLLMQVFKSADLPKPIYAVVTEHSITWPFNELVEHLIEERNRLDPAKGTATE